MAYNNNYRSFNRYNGGYSSGYSKGRSYNRGGSYGRQKKKHSGCSVRNGWTSKRTGERVDSTLLYGWNYSKRLGLISFVACPCKESATANDRYEKWVVGLQFRDGKKTFTGFYNVDRQILIIPDLQMVANPKAPNGGYFGRFYKTK